MQPLARFHWSVLLGCAIFSGLAAFCPGQVVVYNLTSDWSNVNNPNGAWQLNKAPDTPFSILQADYWADSAGQTAWADQPYPQTAHVPLWMKVQSGDTHFGGFATPGTVVMHSAETGRTGTEFSSVTWTSPSDGAITIAGGTWVNKSYDRPQRWELRLNGQSLSVGDLTQADPYTQSNPFDFSLGSGGAAILSQSVQQGDVVELLIYRYSYSPYGTSVGVDLSVNFAPIPEPQVWSLISMGLAAAAIARRRIRRNRTET